MALLGLSVLLLSGVSAGGSYTTDLLPGLAVHGMGIGAGFVAVTIAATGGVPVRDQGLASGLINTSQQVGAAVGIAVLVSVAASVTAGAAGTPAEQLVAGYQAGYLAAAGAALLGVIVCLLVVKDPATAATNRLPGRRPPDARGPRRRHDDGCARPAGRSETGPVDSLAAQAARRPRRPRRRVRGGDRCGLTATTRSLHARRPPDACPALGAPARPHGKHARAGVRSRGRPGVAGVLSCEQSAAAASLVPVSCPAGAGR
jgi:MFS family permease